MPRGPRRNPVLDWSCILLATLAMLIVQTFRYTSHLSSWVVVAESILTLLLLFGLYHFFSFRQIDLNNSVKPHFISLAVMATLPILVQVVTRLLGVGDPNELVLLNIVQNITLALAALPYSKKAIRISGLLSGFLVLFVNAMTEVVLIWCVSVVFAVFGLWWLMCSYWERLETKFASSSNRTIPLKPVILSLTLLLGLGTIVVSTIGIPRTLVALSGFMPTSGGDKYQGNYARSGVGEGDNMIAAQDSAFSFGPVDSDILLESKMPSLYDVASDQYGEARVKKQINKELSQAISLTADRLRHNHQKTVTAEQASRQFSTLRRLSEQRRNAPEERASTALFQVAGVTPLHLATHRFDTFDGLDWTHSGNETSAVKTSMVSVDGKPWLEIVRNRSNILHGKQSHTLRFINLKSKKIPSPGHLSGIHIKDVNRENFYTLATDGLFELAGQEAIPRLTVIHLISQIHSEGGLSSQGDFRRLYPKTTQSQKNQKMPGEAVSELAEKWTQNIESGWAQVIAVTEQLRNNFTHDRLATASEDCADIVEHFLNTRSGPDYMFASTAAQILRTLGYDTQVVMGFYADPKDYDSKTKQTIIESADLHFWTEVRVDRDLWIPIEPTPGYASPQSWLSWQDWSILAYQGVLKWLTDHWSLIIVLLSVLALAITLRHTLFDVGSLLIWKAGWFGSTRQRIIWTVRILEIRAQLAGHSRPVGTTLSKWYLSLAIGNPKLQDHRKTMEQVLILANRAFYAPLSIEHDQFLNMQTGVSGVCWKLLGTWTSRQMKRTTSDLHLKGTIHKND